MLRYRVTGGVVQAASFFLRDQGGNLLTELEWAAGTGAWTRTSDWVYAGREPLVRLGRQNGTNYRTYTTVVTDHLGSTRAEVLDAASPVKMDLWPYGGFVSQPPIVNEKHLFTAHEREFLGTALSTATLANLDSMHQREYTHRHGRFLSLDPVGGSVGSSQSWNRYSYVWGNPVNLVDPYGETVDVGNLDPDQIAELLGQLNEFTGAVWDVDSENRLFLAESCESSSTVAVEFLQELISPEAGVFTVFETEGVNVNEPMGSTDIYLNFSSRDGMRSSADLDLATFNLGSAFVHELRHAATGLSDWEGKPDATSMLDWTGPIIDFVNSIRTERGFATRKAWGSRPTMSGRWSKHAFILPGSGKEVDILAPRIR